MYAIEYVYKSREQMNVQHSYVTLRYDTLRYVTLRDEI